MTLRSTLIIALVVAASSTSFAQIEVHPDLQFYRPNDMTGLNVFETSKEDTIPFDGLKVRVGGDFALQFQGVSQSNKFGSDSALKLVDLGSNVNLPTANLNLDVQLADGMRMHLRTYLSSRHHAEAWVKGGHLQIDKLDFIKKGFLENIMNVTTIRVGLDEFNYGDAHFRRSDNARAIFNPFVGNYIMDSFSTEAFGEVNIQSKGLIVVAGITNGKLNQDVRVSETTDNKMSIYGKLGYDKQLNEDLRLRITGSIYTNQGTSTGTWLYGGDRAGGRYYYVLHTDSSGGSDFEGRVNARFTQLTAFQINPFVKWKGLEFFGIFEVASGSEENTDGYTQIAAEIIYRFGGKDQLYVAGRYNTVDGKYSSQGKDQMVTRFNLGGGWFMTNNVLVKAEFVNQMYDGEGFEGSKYNEAEFSGVVVEAVIGF